LSGREFPKVLVSKYRTSLPPALVYMSTFAKAFLLTRIFCKYLYLISLLVAWVLSFFLWLHVLDCLPLLVVEALNWLYTESGLREYIEPWRQPSLDYVISEIISASRNFNSLKNHLLVKVDPLDRELFRISIKLPAAYFMLRFSVYYCKLFLWQFAFLRALHQKIWGPRPSLISRIFPRNIVPVVRVIFHPVVVFSILLLCLLS
jgi:hypothetical protein